MEAVPQDLCKLPGLGGLAVTVGCLLPFRPSMHETIQLIPLLYRVEEAEAAKIKLILLCCFVIVSLQNQHAFCNQVRPQMKIGLKSMLLSLH